MNKSKILIALTIVLFTSCFSSKVFVNVTENNKLFNSHPFNWFDCANCDSNYDNYIADYFEDNKIAWHFFDEQQLKDTILWLQVHNTVNKIGYNKVISQELYSSEIEGFIDSLLLWDKIELDTSNYYSKFLHRRELQGTRDLSIRIIKDIKFAFTGMQPFYYDRYVNDTIVKLVKYDLALKSKETKISQQFLLDIFNFLKDIGEYTMAYEFTIRPYNFNNYLLDTDSLLLSLPLDTVKEFDYPDNTSRLGYFDRNGNWNDSYIEWKDYPGP